MTDKQLWYLKMTMNNYGSSDEIREAIAAVLHDRGELLVTSQAFLEAWEPNLLDDKLLQAAAVATRAAIAGCHGIPVGPPKVKGTKRRGNS